MLAFGTRFGDVVGFGHTRVREQLVFIEHVGAATGGAVEPERSTHDRIPSTHSRPVGRS